MTNYPIDNVWVSRLVDKKTSGAGPLEQGEIVRSMVSYAIDTATQQYYGIPDSPDSPEHFHLPSFLAAIRGVEDYFGATDRQFKVTDEQNILILAKTSFSVRPRQDLLYKRG